jgi:hypothetical protein
MNLHFNRKIEKLYPSVTARKVVESKSTTVLNPSLNVGIQFKFSVGDSPANLLIEPYSKFYFLSQEIRDSNMLSMGFRFVYMTDIYGD